MGGERTADGTRLASELVGVLRHKHGTGGSGGVGFLKAALELTIFPEILAVRTDLGEQG